MNAPLIDIRLYSRGFYCRLSDGLIMVTSCFFFSLPWHDGACPQNFPVYLLISKLLTYSVYNHLLNVYQTTSLPAHCLFGYQYCNLINDFGFFIGKFLFCVMDIVAGYLCFELSRSLSGEKQVGSSQ